MPSNDTSAHDTVSVLAREQNAAPDAVGLKQHAETVVRELLDKRLAEIHIEPASLDEVAEKDRPLVWSVLYAMLACKHPDVLCTSWSVSCTNTHYIVNGMLPSDGNYEVNVVDLQLIRSVSPFRISEIGVVCQQNKPKIVVEVLNHMQRRQVTEAEVLFTGKRSRQWL